MKKILAIALAAMLLLSLAACGGNSQPNNQQNTPNTTTVPTTGNTTVPQDTTPTGGEESVYSFQAEGVELIPGTAFDPAVLPAASILYTVPSCAIEGTDNVYSYDTFEITAYNDGTGEVIYSILLIDPNLATNEGLYLGDDLARVTELYGSDYTENGTELIYEKGETSLRIVMDGEFVASIEYRMVTG